MLLLVVLMPLALASQTNVALTYDANGNLLTNGDKRYVYDGFNRLAEVFINETIKEKYWYDPDGNRLLKVEFHTDGSNTTTFYIDESFIRIINSSGTYDEVYYYDEYDLIAKEDSEGKKFYHPDHLGSTTLVTDESGNIVEETVYDPFGAVQEGGNERYDYEGKEVDSTGLQYFGARYYDPNKIFKWTQPDDLLPDVYDPQQLNRYSFERNNPYKYEDEDGTTPVCIEEVSCTAVGIYLATPIIATGVVYSINLVGDRIPDKYKEQIRQGLEQYFKAYSKAGDVVSTYNVLSALKDYSDNPSEENSKKLAAAIAEAGISEGIERGVSNFAGENAGNAFGAMLHSSGLSKPSLDKFNRDKRSTIMKGAYISEARVSQYMSRYGYSESTARKKLAKIDEYHRKKNERNNEDGDS